jgi:hypothetical protein
VRDEGPPGLEPDESQPDVPPPWLGPPPFEVGVPLAVAGVICHNDVAAIALTSVVAHRAGVVLAFRTIDRRGRRLGSFPGSPERGGPGGGTRPERRLAAEYADGRFAIDPDPDSGFDMWTAPPTPVLTRVGADGSGDDGLWVQDERLWLWPLPPAGPLALVATWLQAGLDGRVDIDGAAVLAAAAQAELIWPEQ